MIARSTEVGVLALQGSSAPHAAALRMLGHEVREVRAPEDLEGLSRLVLPGGESTTIRHLMDLFDLARPIVARHRARALALFATCAGTILLSRHCGARPAPLGLLDVDVERNAYGRQVDSFGRTISLADGELRGIFIRAPRITRVGSGVEVLARDGADPVLVRSPGILAATFHPELGDDPLLHRRFVESDPWLVAEEAQA